MSRRDNSRYNKRGGYADYDKDYEYDDYRSGKKRRRSSVSPQKQQRLEKQKKKIRLSRRVGITLAFIALILSAAFIGLLKFADILLTQYLMIAVIVFALLFLIGYLTQYTRKPLAAGKFVSVFTIIIVCVASVYVLIGLGALSKITGADDVNLSEPFAVYMSGNDTYDSMSEYGRSDTNIIAFVNPDTATVLLLSTPRDYYVPLQADYDFNVKDGFSGSGQYDKLTHAGNYGIGVSIGTLEEICDADIDFYLKVNFTGFIDIIDALGGITIENESAFTSWDGYYYAAGTLRLDGIYALNYARERHAFATGDFQRGENQMKVIKAMVSKAASPAILSGYATVMSSVASSFDTNMSDDGIKSIVKYEQSLLSKGVSWNMVSFSVSGDTGSRNVYSASSKASVVIPDETSIANAKILIDMVLNGEELTQDHADSLK